MACELVTVQPGFPADNFSIIDCWPRLNEIESGDDINFWVEVANDSATAREVAVLWRLSGVDVLSAAEVVDPGSARSFWVNAGYGYLRSAVGTGDHALEAEIVQLDGEAAQGTQPVDCGTFTVLSDDPPTNPCDGVECGPCETCEGGDCVPIDCPSGEECVDGDCVPVNPCEGVECGECETCEGGDCVPVDNPCCGVSCGPCRVCEGGECVPVDNPCCGVSCGDGEVCEGGECVVVDPPDPCADVTCGECLVCENGNCVETNPCCGVSCPDGDVCEDGQCVPADDGTDGRPALVALAAIFALAYLISN